MNTVVYNTLLDTQARVGAMDEVSEIVAAMAADACAPDQISLSTICKGYCMKGDLDKAFEVFRQMQTNNMAADSIIYNTMLDGCTRHNRMDLADEVLKDFEAYKIKPSNFTLGILVKMYGRRKQLDKAFEIVEVLPKQHGFKANAQIRAGLICACLSNRCLDRALEVLSQMRVDGQLGEARAFNVLIGALVRQGRLQEAVDLVREAYGLRGKAATLAAGQYLDNEPIELLLQALSQRGLMESVGLQLIEGLRATAGQHISCRFLATLGQNTGYTRTRY
jgi:pentatricopeptide repeat protein